MNLNLNYGFWVIIRYHCRLLNCKKYSILRGDVDGGKGYACAGAESIMGTLRVSLNFSIGHLDF